VRATCMRLSDALLVMESVALKIPVAVGANFTLMGVLCPAARVTGRVEVRENTLVEMVIAVMLTEADPELVALTVRVLLEPVVTLPNATDAFCKERVPTEVEGGPPALTP